LSCVPGCVAALDWKAFGIVYSEVLQILPMFAWTITVPVAHGYNLILQLLLRDPQSRQAIEAQESVQWGSGQRWRPSHCAGA
jgi:hypothetical protein